MSFVLALDQGTTSSRAILFDRSGAIRGIAQQEFEQHFPQPGWVEHDATEIRDTQLSVAQQVLKDAGVAGDDVAAIGITNQRETVVLWDRKTGQPVHHALVWQDRRTAGFCDELRDRGLSEMIVEKTGLVIDPYFSGTKLRWLLNNVPGAREKAGRGELAFGTIDSWLVFCLTEGRVHVTDASNASRTMLFNIRSMEWDAELLDLLGIPESVLPEVRGCSETYGHTRLLGGDIPISGMAGDQQAALFGQACYEPGMAKNTYGTGCFMLMNTGDQPVRSANDLLTTVAWQLNGQATYALEGSVFVGGAVVQWLRDGLGIIEQASDVEALAASVPDNGGVYLVPAFVGLGAPHWDPYARGTLVGLTRGSGRGHIARAAIESIAYQSYDVVQAMIADSGLALTELRVDGGAARNEMLIAFQADLLGAPVVRPAVLETTALGAAFLAGLAVGYWESMDEISALWSRDRVVEPSMPRQTTDSLLHSWHRAVGRSRHWIEPEGTL